MLYDTSTLKGAELFACSLLDTTERDRTDVRRIVSNFMMLNAKGRTDVMHKRESKSSVGAIMMRDTALSFNFPTTKVKQLKHLKNLLFTKQMDFQTFAEMCEVHALKFTIEELHKELIMSRI